MSTLSWSPRISQALNESFVFNAKSVGVRLLQPLDLVFQDRDAALVRIKWALKYSGSQRQILKQR